MPHFDVGFVLRHPLFLVTYIIAVPAWIIAFASQCASEAQYIVHYLWYNIWIQLAVIVHLFLALCSDSLAIHRFQLAVVLAVAEVFAVYGAEFIFSDRGSLIAVGVGWLLLAMVDLIWLLYLTSEEDSLFYRLLNAGGNGGLSSYSRRGHQRESVAGFNGVETGIGSHGVGVGDTYQSERNQSSYTMGGPNGYAPAATNTTPQKAGPSVSYNPQSPSGEDDQYRHRAKAMYAYNASPDDPNEVSFAKGDILEVVDNTGKWFQVRTPSGQTGIAPSNYLAML